MQAGIDDTRGLVHALGLHLAVGVGVSVVCYVERKKAHNQFAMAKVS
jgi:hypothetical protein